MIPVTRAERTAHDQLLAAQRAMREAAACAILDDQHGRRAWLRMAARALERASQAISTDIGPLSTTTGVVPVSPTNNTEKKS